MIPLLYIFSLCVILSNGQENCDYKWVQLEDRSTFETTYWMLGGTYQAEDVAAFVIPKFQAVYFYDTDMEVIVHEIEHVKCNLENTDETLRKLCNFNIDLEYNVQSRPDNYDEWQGVTDNTPPERTQKMGFQDLMYSNKEIPIKPTFSN